MMMIVLFSRVGVGGCWVEDERDDRTLDGGGTGES